MDTINEKTKKIYDYWRENFDEPFKDKYFRDLEFELYLSHISSSDLILDAGCGMGDVVFKVAQKARRVLGVDFQLRRIQLAMEILKNETCKNISFFTGDILNVPFKDETFHTVITSRTIINLPSWELQKTGINEVHRVLKSNGKYLCFEVTEEGWAGYNLMREMFGLEPVKVPWRNLLLNEGNVEVYFSKFFKIINVHRFGMYYFISRIVHPLLVLPDKPKFDTPLNQIAAEICRKLPQPFSKASGLEKATYYVCYVLEKK